MSNTEDRAQLLAEMARDLQQPHEESTATAVAQGALRTVPDADVASVTISVRRGRFVTLGSSDELAADLDGWQYEMGEGPCMDAARTQDWYRSGDLALDRRWPRWGPRASEAGASSLLSISLIANEGTFGALNLYAREAGRFVERDQVDLAVLYATHSALALSSSRQVEGLQTAMHSRHVIGVAQGILMERYAIDLDRSFELLRRYSSDTNTKLADVARELVTGRKLRTHEQR